MFNIMKRIEYIIDDLTLVLNNTVCLNLVPKNSNSVIKFRTGQYGLISFLRGSVLSAERPFSFASSMAHSETLQFGFRISGQFTGEVAKLKKGDSVFVRGPFGAFVFDEKKYNDAVFIAAGIGITPFLSAVRYVSEKTLPNKMALIYSNTSEKEVPFYNELKQLEAINQNFKAYFLITKPESVLDPKMFISGRINKEIITNVINDNTRGKTFFICGPEPFMIATIALLRAIGVKEKDIKTEGFSQIPMSFFENGTHIFPLVAGTSALLAFVTLASINQIEITKAMVKAQNDQTYTQQQSTQSDIQITDPQSVVKPSDLITSQSAQTQLDPQQQALLDLANSQSTPIQTQTDPVVTPLVVNKIPRKTTSGSAASQTTIIKALTKTTTPVNIIPATVKNSTKVVSPAQAYVAPKKVVPTTVFIPPKTVTPAPVYVPPKIVTPAPVYVPPVVVTPAPVYTPPAPVYVPPVYVPPVYTPSARTRSS